MALIEVKKGATLVVSESAFRARETDIVIGKKAKLIVVADGTTTADRIARAEED